MIKAEWTNADALDLQPTCNQLATDLISRKAAIDALTHKWDGMVTSVFDVLKELPSAEPMESHHRYEQGIIEGRVQMRTEMLEAIKDIVGDEVWNGI